MTVANPRVVYKWFWYQFNYHKCFVNICPAANHHFYLLIYSWIYILLWKHSCNSWALIYGRNRGRMKHSQSRFALERNNTIISLFSAVILGIIGRKAEINWGLFCNSPSLSQRAMLSLTYFVYQMLFKDHFCTSCYPVSLFASAKLSKQLDEHEERCQPDKSYFSDFSPRVTPSWSTTVVAVFTFGQWEPSAPLSYSSAD